MSCTFSYCLRPDTRPSHYAGFHVSTTRLWGRRIVVCNPQTTCVVTLCTSIRAYELYVGPQLFESPPCIVRALLFDRGRQVCRLGCLEHWSGQFRRGRHSSTASSLGKGTRLLDPIVACSAERMLNLVSMSATRNGWLAVDLRRSPVWR